MPTQTGRPAKSDSRRIGEIVMYSSPSFIDSGLLCPL
jgi:hypothetical protein